MKLLLTGEPGVGKSTLLAKVIESVKHTQGFLTREERIDGNRVGFEMIASNGKRFELASVSSTSKFRVSRYGVDIDGLEKFVTQLDPIWQDTLLYIDEIGQMQLGSESFKDLVEVYLRSDNPLVGTMSKIYNDNFTESLHKRTDIEIIEVTLDNRDFLEHEILRRIAQFIH